MSDAQHQDPYGSSGAAARWNPKGARMIYAAGSPSLALLEYLCIRGIVEALRQWYLIEFEVTDERLVGELDTRKLPGNWKVLPHGRATQNFGRKWLEDREFPFLKVPSARLDPAFYPREFNVLINPDFEDLASVLKVVNNKPFNYLLNGQ